MLVYDARCNKCSAPVRWCKGADGKRIPLDPRPSGKGNLILLSQGGRDVAVVARPEHGDQPRYQSHFASCPEAAAHGKAKP